MSITSATVASPFETVADDLVDAVDDERLNLIHVTDGPADEVAAALPLQIPQALRLQFVINRVSEEQNELLRHAVHDVGAECAKRLAEHVNHEQPDDRGEEQAELSGNATVKRKENRQHGRGGRFAGEDQIVGHIFPDQSGKQLTGSREDQQRHAKSDPAVIRPKHLHQSQKDPAGAGGDLLR
jgi:hypothetical protein